MQRKQWLELSLRFNNSHPGKYLYIGWFTVAVSSEKGLISCHLEKMTLFLYRTLDCAT